MFRLLPCLLLLAALARAEEPAVFTIKTLPAQMRYDVTELLVHPGQDVKITFENPDDMPHNLVFFQPGTDVIAVCNQQMEKPDEALKRNWLPEDPRMWMHSKTLNPKEKEELVFKAPEKIGLYPFVCSMPGHAAIMNGQMKVYAPGPKFTDLKFSLYLGSWRKLPDFTALTPHRQGDVPGGLLEFKFDDYKNEFGLVFTGQLMAPETGEYTFDLACDDGARVLIDGKPVVEFDGIHSSGTMKEGKAKLEAGPHAVRVEYFQYKGGAEIYLGWSGPKFNLMALSKWVPAGVTATKPKKKVVETGLPFIVGREPILYRNFIEGGGERCVGVGFPGQVSLAWNAEVMNLALVWRGAFLDAAKHWNGRGGGAQRPLGYDVMITAGVDAPPFAVLPNTEAEWPRFAAGDRPPGYQWKGYTLDAQRWPTFHYAWQGVLVAEHYEGTGDAVQAGGQLVRTLRLTGRIPEGAQLRVVSGAVRNVPGGSFFVDGSTSYTVEVEGGRVRGNDLLVFARPEIKITYGWPMRHAAAP